MSPNDVTFGNFLTNLSAFFGGGGGTVSSVEQLASRMWLAITVVGYLLAFAGLGAIVYILMRLFDLRAREKEFYETLILPAESSSAVSSRWMRIRELAGGASPSGWREAIIEADIMLDDALARRGYTGDMGEKLRQAPLATLRGAQEAHGVRNRVAHQGSEFDLSPTLVARTLAQYEAALRELGAI